MKFGKADLWYTLLTVSPHRRRGPVWFRWSDNLRCIFSKTGQWDPQLTFQTRQEIEDHWRPLIQQLDQKHCQISPENKSKEKYYALSMFPYPSGNLHLGHVRVYTISDVMARYQRSKGKFVIHPMGWDAFGLPAENAAIERGINPKDWTYSNIKRMKHQLQELGLSFDWSKELATCEPSYYKGTQYIFLKMFEQGLAFQKKAQVNWDPVDMTVLADEQIDETGCSWRSGAKVEKKYLMQWYLRCTSFSEALLKGLEEVDKNLWRDIILLQRHWIGECKGCRINFVVVSESDSSQLPLSVYTENLDLIFGVSHLSVKPSHHLCVDFGVTDIGAVLPVHAVHPFTREKLKVVVADEKHMHPNKDVMLAIPCISKEDLAVAERLGISYSKVLDTADSDHLQAPKELRGLSRQEALDHVRKQAQTLGIGGEKISQNLNDWLISRQRYWGTPIPIIHCNKCGSVPVPYEDLPVELPDIEGLSNKGGRSPLADIDHWFNVMCPKCGSEARRETDTMDTFVDSTWYFLRYLDPHNGRMPFDPQVADRYMPVDLYVGGKEHAVLHLYYARFMCHFLHSVGLLNHREPFINLLTQGMVKGESFRVKDTGKYLPRDKVDTSGAAPVEAETGAELVIEWEKMSKSKYNGVNPEDVLREFGVDSTRLCMLSNVSPQSDRNWSHIVYKGVLNWQGRIWSLVTNQRSCRSNEQKGQGCAVNTEELGKWEKKIDETRNCILNNVSFEFDRTFHINAAISRLHSYVTWLMKVPPEVASISKAYERALADLIVMLSPMAPHFSSELWAGLADVAQFQTHQWDLPVLEQAWPKLDEDFLVPLICKVNDVDILEVGVPYKDLDKLDKHTALNLVQKDSIFQEKFSQHQISSSLLKVVDGHKASLSLRLPEYDFQISGPSAEKAKAKKKLSRQRVRLYSTDLID